MKKLFIFDVDGTLVNSYPAIEKSLNFTRKQLGYPLVGPMKVKRSIGKGDTLFIAEFFKNQDRFKALNIYRKHHEKALVKFSRLMPKARMILHTLRRRKKVLAIASNRPKKFTLLLLDRLRIKKYFDGVWCADEIGALKPKPKILNMILGQFRMSRPKSIYIGDMDIDLETAKRAKIDAVFVKGGSSTLKEVGKYRNKRVISNLGEIAQIYN